MTPERRRACPPNEKHHMSSKLVIRHLLVGQGPERLQPRAAQARDSYLSCRHAAASANSHLDGVGSELAEEVAVLAKGLCQAQGEGDLGHTAVDLLREFREAAVPDHAVGEDVAEDEALAVLGEGLGLKEAKDLLGLRVVTKHGRGKTKGRLLLVRGLRLEVEGLNTCMSQRQLFQRSTPLCEPIRRSTASYELGGICTG